MSHEDVRLRIGYLVKQLGQEFRRTSEVGLRELGLSMSQYAVLRALADVPGASASELARRTFVTRQSLRDVLAGLRRAGLATVAERPVTGRALPVTLTTAGRDLLERAEVVVTAVEQRMLTDLPGADVRTLASLLTACTRNLVGADPTDPNDTTVY